MKAAIRVLERDGPLKFTTIRVAEAAGVSVGSLYQYFPNKQAILYRLQLDEWQATGAMLERILGNTQQPPRDRLRAVIHAFIQSECDEAPLRQALDAATPHYHDAPESQAGRERSQTLVDGFVAALAPKASAAQRRPAGELIFMTLSAIGKEISERHPTKREITRWADAVTDMLGAYLTQLG